jgi:succinate dehydrogenase/fumarate reductase flavoprotein subunit
MNKTVANAVLASATNQPVPFTTRSAIASMAKSLETGSTAMNEGLTSIQRQINAFLLSVPAGVANVIIHALPITTRSPEEIMGPVNAAMGQLLDAAHDYDASALRRALQQIEASEPQVSAAQLELRQAEAKWEEGKARFTCAIQVSQTKHTVINELPQECTGHFP